MKARTPLKRMSDKKRAALGDRRIYSTVSAPKKPRKETLTKGSSRRTHV